jgi:hypothetical protein
VEFEFGVFQRKLPHIRTPIDASCMRLQSGLNHGEGQRQVQNTKHLTQYVLSMREPER